jgi:hypothetical protein
VTAAQPEPEMYPADKPSARACLAWRCDRDAHPLIKVLAAGDADAEAQALAAELLMLALKKKLPAPREFLRDERIIISWLMFRHMGAAGSEQAKSAVMQQFGISLKAVEKVIYGNPEMVEAVRKQLGLNV